MLAAFGEQGNNVWSRVLSMEADHTCWIAQMPNALTSCGSEYVGEPCCTTVHVTLQLSDLASMSGEVTGWSNTIAYSVSAIPCAQRYHVGSRLLVLRWGT